MKDKRVESRIIKDHLNPLTKDQLLKMFRDEYEGKCDDDIDVDELLDCIYRYIHYHASDLGEWGNAEEDYHFDNLDY